MNKPICSYIGTIVTRTVWTTSIQKEAATEETKRILSHGGGSSREVACSEAQVGPYNHSLDSSETWIDFQSICQGFGSGHTNGVSS